MAADPIGDPTKDAVKASDDQINTLGLKDQNTLLGNLYVLFKSKTPGGSIWVVPNSAGTFSQGNDTDSIERVFSSQLREIAHHGQ